MKITLLLATGENLLLEGLLPLFRQRSDMRVAGQTGVGRMALRMAHALRPRVVVVDSSLPNPSGIETTRQMVSRCARTKVLILSSALDRGTVAKAFGAGAMGYVLKQDRFCELVQAIQTVATGRVHVSHRISNVVIEDYVQNVAKVSFSATSILTPREREVLHLLVEGRNTKAVAATLHVSVKTVNAHRKQVMNKLELHSLADLTKYAIREGLTSLDSP